jgi:biotin carboxyl carrier protein
MRLNTLIQGHPGRLWIEGGRFRYEREDGQAVEGEFSCEPQGDGSRSILIGGRSYSVSRSAVGHVSVNGWSLAAEVFDPRSLRSRKTGQSGTGPYEIAAPMPGKVVRVLVAAGDSVEAGQGLVVVEAMKMQNEMKSPRAGRVVEVRTRADAAVLAGEALVIVE